MKYLLVILFIFMTIFLFSYEPKKISGDFDVTLRVYQGLREGSKIITQTQDPFYLKKIDVKNVFSEISVLSEKRELTRIFNLKGIKIISMGTMMESKRDEGQYLAVNLLQDRKLLIRLLTLNKKENKFKVEVVDNGEKSHLLLESDLIMPLKKSTIIGFEDPKLNVFFLSFFREEPKSGKPRLLSHPSPDYPKDAQEQGIEGKVILECITDEQGNVESVYAVEGPEILIKPAVEALKKWKYEPYLVKGIAKPVKFSVIVKFSLKDKSPKKGSK
jgi:TonB family protein